MRRVIGAASLFGLVWLLGCAPEGPTAFVTYNLVPSQNCTVTPQNTGNKFFPVGRYDISPGGKGLGTACAHSYVVNLLVNSYLRPNSDMTLGRAEPDVLQLHNAEVTLTNVKDEVIKFDRTKPALPNPFSVSANNSLFPAVGNTPSIGVAAIEAIPKAYALQLDNFAQDGSQIVAHIRIFGTTTGNIDIDFKPFVYPIDICEGCLTRCESELTKNMKMHSDILGPDTCDDNQSSDDRICFDSSC